MHTIMSQLFAHFLSFFVSLLHHHVADKSFGDYFLHELLPSADGCVLCAQFSQLFFISKLLLMQKCNCTPIDYRLCVELFFAVRSHLHNNNLCQLLKSTKRLNMS